MTAAPNDPRSPVTRTSKIGLWGASGSGKTTYLASLFVAATQSRPRRWNIAGENQESVEFLTHKTNTLTEERRFPKFTQGIQNLSWTVMGTTERTVKKRFGKTVETVPLRFRLDMLDAEGGLYESPSENRDEGDEGDLDIEFDDVRHGDPERLIDQLTECDGIIYLFDPLRENKKGDAYRHFQWALQNILSRAARNGTIDGMYLRHHLAVCVTKLDDPKVFHTADKLRYLVTDPEDPYQFPRVRDDYAEDLFRKLGELSPTRSAVKVHDAIQAAFHPGRVRYFATSAVGFYLERGAQRCRWENFQNVVRHPTIKDEYQIRGDINPINVLEPLLWLGQVTSR
ncbi:MAG TPA: hypothetical protein VHJ17_16850 [Thermomonospora sp.]|nr:hypothetical protein [Thermomonospora sp.]